MMTTSSRAITEYGEEQAKSALCAFTRHERETPGIRVKDNAVAVALKYYWD